MSELRTPRVLLRHWRASDREPFAALNADPIVMEHFPEVMSRADSDAFAERIAAGLDQRGWGLWAAELTTSAAFIGFVGLSQVSFEAAFTPAIEIGWRLARPVWGHGLATEAAAATLEHAFGPLGFAEIVSFTSMPNRRSQRVMAKLGMHHDPADDFDHPRLPPWHRLRRQVLYRLARPVSTGL